MCAPIFTGVLHDFGFSEVELRDKRGEVALTLSIRLITVSLSSTSQYIVLCEMEIVRCYVSGDPVGCLVDDSGHNEELRRSRVLRVICAQSIF
jgi:hypothetical protein